MKKVKAWLIRLLIDREIVRQMVREEVQRLMIEVANTATIV